MTSLHIQQQDLSDQAVVSAQRCEVQTVVELDVIGIEIGRVVMDQGAEQIIALVLGRDQQRCQIVTGLVLQHLRARHATVAVLAVTLVVSLHQVVEDVNVSCLGSVVQRCVALGRRAPV